MVVLLVYAILLGLALGIIISIARLATELPEYASAAQGLVTSATARLAELGVGPEQLRQAAGALDLGKLAGVLGALLSSIAGLASNFTFLLALLLFLGVESGGAADRMASIAAERPRAVEALSRFATGTRQYLLVTTVFGLIVAVLDWAALAILGIPPVDSTIAHAHQHAAGARRLRAHRRVGSHLRGRPPSGARNRADMGCSLKISAVAI